MAISETDGVITYRNAFPVWVRVFVGIIGAVMTVLGPATMVSIAAPGWTWSFVLTVFTGAVLFLFGVFALVACLSALTTLEFRIDEHALLVSKRGPLGRSRRRYDFSEVTAPSLTMRDSEDGAYPAMTLRVGNRRSRFEMTGFADVDEARRWQQRLVHILVAPV